LDKSLDGEPFVEKKLKLPSRYQTGLRRAVDGQRDHSSTREVKRIRSGPSLTPIPAEPTVSVESTMYEESESTIEGVGDSRTERTGAGPRSKGSTDRDASLARSYSPPRGVVRIVLRRVQP
jgi:hypothetical protein